MTARCRHWIVFLLLALAVRASGASGVRLLLGVTDRESTKWDGSVTARGARITALEPWRFDGEDSLGAGNTWHLSTHLIRLLGAARVIQPTTVANGVIVWLEDERNDGVLDVQTAQGNFSAPLSGIPYGTIEHLLGGRVAADRVPSATRITSTSEEQDYPAAA